MKGHKHHHHHPRAEHKKGGKVESAMHGDHIADKAPHEVYAGAGSNVVKEAEEHKHGGRAKRKTHKHVGHVHGHHTMHHAGRKPRKSGGKVGADTHPLSSAHKGTPAKGHSDIEMD
jgi:hypothetical protein